MSPEQARRCQIIMYNIIVFMKHGEILFESKRKYLEYLNKSQ